MEIITLLQENRSEKDYGLEQIPDTCPYCGVGIVPIPIIGYFQNVTDPGPNRNDVQVVFQCPRVNCKALFITQYSHSWSASSGHSFFIRHDLYKDSKIIRFGQMIEEISPQFVKIYNQAYQAEQLNLSLISGPGYRKSLEFLIKDYVLRSISSEDERNKILRSFLNNVIQDKIDDERIKAMAKRAAWLGNDETHYTRIWSDQDIDALKALITMTTNWILLVEESKKYISEMPD